MKKTLLNPCEYIKTYHYHYPDIHGSVKPKINRLEKSHLVSPSQVFYMFDKNFLKCENIDLPKSFVSIWSENFTVDQLNYQAN